MRVLGLIPARGGSKGIPQKNIRSLCGKPLLQYTVEAALRANTLARIVLTTDDEEIAELGRTLAVDVPFMRPKELALDETPMIPVAQHAIGWLEKNGDRFDAVCLLQPTNPLRRPEDIDGAVGLLQMTGADSVISFVDVGEKHPARMKLLTADRKVIDPPFGEQFEGQRRQELTHLYLREGSIYLTRRDTIMKEGSFKGHDCRAWIMPEERACNIDTELDFFFAEFLIQRESSINQKLLLANE